jgi:hypothetical protein
MLGVELKKQDKFWKESEMKKDKCRVEVGIYPHRMSVGGVLKVMGYYVYVGGVLGSGMQTGAGFQFVGMHKCLCFTMDIPDNIKDVVALADESIKVGSRNVLWLGKVKWYDIEGGGFKYYLPTKVWGLRQRLRGRKLSTMANVTVAKGRDGRSYAILSVPELRRVIVYKNKS